MKKQKTQSILNRRARYDYDLEDEIVAGISLSGPEVRAARDGHVQLKGSYATIRNGELWLDNASFSLKNNQSGKSEPRTVDLSPRKLLLNKKQLEKLIENKKTGMTIVPVRMLTGGRYIKLVIAPGKGKRRYDKRQSIKQREQQRESRRLIGG